jgi:phosphatidylglycerophosphate synthase
MFFVFQCPQWSFALCALGLFVYQSLDAIDGKQARRTDSCSPLGELFDHGCDALSMGLCQSRDVIFAIAELGRFAVRIFQTAF